MNYNDENNSSLEAALIAQEHRLIPVLVNFYKFGLKRSDINSGDPRSPASIQALFWRLFSPSTAVTIGVSVISVFTLIIAIEANNLIKDQNSKIETQLFLEEANRRSALIFELTSILDQINAEISADEKTWEKGVVEEYRRSCPDESIATNPACPKRSISPRLRGRVAALSRSLRPYYYLEVDPESLDYEPGKFFSFRDELISAGITKRPLSPERAQLLISLIATGLDVRSDNNYNFSYSDLEEINFRNSSLERVFLSGSNLNRTDFVRANLRQSTIMNASAVKAKFYNSNLAGALLLQTDFEGADFRQAILSGASARNAKFKEAKMKKAKLEGTILYGADFSQATGLEVEQILVACMDPETTQLPSSLKFDWNSYYLPRSCEKP